MGRQIKASTVSMSQYLLNLSFHGQPITITILKPFYSVILFRNAQFQSFVQTPFKLVSSLHVLPAGAPIWLNYPSVGATETLMMAAVLAEGETVIHNAAQEPEVLPWKHLLVAFCVDSCSISGLSIACECYDWC